MSENSAPPTRPVLQLVAIDCPDAAALAAFYAGILGWEVQADDDDDDWVSILPPGADEGTVHVAFQQVRDYVAPTWPGGDHPQQLHLDLKVADLAAGEAQVLAAGEQLVDGGGLGGQAHPVAHGVGLGDDVEPGDPGSAARGDAQRRH
ncbi:MAG: VOC family protein, partial [Ornithinibacter sp.]